MKQTMRVGVMAGLLVAPAAIVSANENVVVDENASVIVESNPKAITYSTVVAAATDSLNGYVTDMRLKEIYALNEDSNIPDVQAYKDTLNTVIPDPVTDPLAKEIKNLLLLKLDYLETMKGLKKDLYQLNNDIASLNIKNPDTIEKVGKVREYYDLFAENYLDARDSLDKEVKQVESDPEYTDFLNQAFGTLGVYPMSPDAYLKKAIPKTDTLIKFENSIVKPGELINKLMPITVGADTTPIQFNLNTFVAMDPTTEAEATEFRTQASAIIYYLNNNNLTADEKAIFRAHKLADGRIVGEVIDSADKDIAAADKVEQLITAMETTVFKSDSTFTSKVKAINTAYDKLTKRGQQLVKSYNSKIAIDTDASGKKIGYMSADAVIAQIKALKAAGTQDYRDAVVAARAAYNDVAASYQAFILNEPTLSGLEADITKAMAFETLVVDLDDPSKEPTAQKITDARTNYNSLTSNQKKVALKDSYTSLQNWEKIAKSSITVNTAITKIKIENNKAFGTNVEKAQKSYEALGSTQQQKLVDSKDRVKLLTPLANLTAKYYALKLGTTDDYRNNVGELTTALDDTNKATLTENAALDTYTTYNDDVTALQKLFDALKALVTPKQTEVNNAKAVETLIETAKSATGSAQLTAITTARAAYTDLLANEKKIVNNLKTLTELEKIVQQPATVTKQVLEVDPSAATFESKAKAAITAYDKLTTSQKAYLDAEVKNQIEDYKTVLAFITDMKALKVANASYRDDVKALQKRIPEIKSGLKTTAADKKQAFNDALDKYDATLTANDKMIGNSDIVVALIEELPKKYGQAFNDAVKQIESEYAKLSADAKKLVTNYKAFQTYTKDSAAAFKVVDLINNTYILNVDVANSGYTKAMETAIKAYDKLTSPQRMHVYNYDSRLKPYLKVYEVVVAVNNLKPTSKTYVSDVATVRKMYDALSATEKTYLEPILSKITSNETSLTDIQKVIDLINDTVPGTEGYVEKLKAARIAYDKLDPAYQKLVTNYKTLQDREKAMAPVTSSIYQIGELELLLKRPFNDATDFVKKYQDAIKAYEKIAYENRVLVTNREVLLNTIYPVASTLQAILNIKEGSKTFGADVANARAMYDQLSASDKKLITNYSKLLGYETLAASGSAVDALIKAIPTKSGQAYMQAIKNARAAYDQLSATEKKTVAYYTELQNFEKAVKSVLTAIDLIDALQTSSNLVTAYDKAMAALDKLTSEQRAMVSNINKLTAVMPAIEVYKMIANLKPSSETYSGAVQAAYASYNRLSTAEKQYVTNFAVLQEAKNNIDNLAKVIAKIAEILPGSRNYATQVQEAMALYNSLPASMKKLVTNYDALKNSKSEVDAIEKVRSLIGEIDVNSMTFVTKVVAARAAYDMLSTTQKRLVSNYFMLEEYEKKLGTMF